MYKITRDTFSAHFQILSELSAWNEYVCSKETRRVWIRQSGGELTPAERQALRVFAREMRRGPDEAWGQLLTANRVTRDALRQHPDWKSLFLTIDSAFRLFKPRFYKLYQKSKSRMHEIKKLLKQELKLIISDEKHLHQFLDITHHPYLVNLTILLPKPKGYDAWAYGKDHITLSPPHIGAWDNVRRTLVHEYGHIIVRNNPRLSKKIFLCSKQIPPKTLRQYSQKTGLSPEGIVEELFLSSLLPEGRLGTLLFPKSRPWRVSVHASRFERLRAVMAKLMRSNVERRWKTQCSANEFWKEFCAKIQYLFKKKNPLINNLGVYFGIN